MCELLQQYHDLIFLLRHQKQNGFLFGLFEALLKLFLKKGKIIKNVNTMFRVSGVWFTCQVKIEA